MGKINLFIDGAQISAEDGSSVLEAALAADIYIPHICSHPDLTTQGGCKLCVVEIEGIEGTVSSCETTVAEGMKVTTKSDRLTRLRNTAMEFMLAGHPAECTSCKAYLNCELQALKQYLGVVHSRMKEIHKENNNINTGNPLIVREMERCIQCGRCVRVCKDIRGVGILDYQKKNDETYIGTTDDLPLADSGCRFCSACVEVCPTGALVDANGVFRTDIRREDALVPCSADCPAGIDIPTYLRLVNEGKNAEAVAVIREKVPFPHALGHVCNHACEKACKRDKLNEAVSIREIKRYAVEHDTQSIWKDKSVQKPDTGKKVAVIGGGATGLTAAYYLRKAGHSVTVLERQKMAGGMMSLGIPSYRLPREDVQREISYITDAGVELKTDHNVKSVSDLKSEGYDAILVAVGASAGKKIPLPGVEYGKNVTAVELLRKVSLGEAVPEISAGTKVMVLGGGNVAFDSARTCRRLGAEVSVVCLEARENMLADEEEIVEAQEEGITVCSGKTNIAIEGKEGELSGLRCADVKEFRFEEGRLIVETVPDTEQVLPCDVVVFAAGQKTDLTEEFGLELNKFGYPVYNMPKHDTSQPGVFVAGDVVTGTKFVISAIVQGREAASEMDIYLGGDGDISEKLVDVPAPSPEIGLVEGFAQTKREVTTPEDVEKRRESFCRVNLGLDDEQAKCESGRCLQCDLRRDFTHVRLWTDYKVK